MKKKNKFHIDNYQFKIVKMDVFNIYETNEKNDFIYYLLIDQDNFIHDYKIQVASKSLFIKTKTTKSHETKSDAGLIRRLEIINLLGLKHEFGSGKKKIDEINNSVKLKELNDFMFDMDWRKITFQKIEYIITASNSSGQGKGSGTFKTTHNNNKYAFGFLFQCLNVSKQIENAYENVDYSNEWKKIEDKNNLINFSDWLNENEIIEEYLKKFKYLSDDLKWKTHKRELEIKLNKNKQEFILLENKISKLRSQQKRNIEKLYESEKDISSKMYKEYFDIDSSLSFTKYDTAHIKPVWLIKNEYIESKDENILEQISDPFNFLPLSNNVHKLYDDEYFYWDLEGKLTKLKEKIKEHEYSGFEKINNDKIEKIKKYLNEYFKKIVINL